MDYTEILKVLNEASTFDLFRLNVAISNQLKEPKRLLAIKRQLRLGQAVEYYEPESNSLIPAHVYKLGRTRVGVTNDTDGKRWTLPYYWLNLESVDINIGNMAKRGMDRNALKVGDMVGYRSKKGNDVYGKIIRLNPKTVTVQLNNGEEWRVSYSFLFPVMDGEAAVQTNDRGLLIEGCVVGKAENQ